MAGEMPSSLALPGSTLPRRLRYGVTPNASGQHLGLSRPLALVCFRRSPACAVSPASARAADPLGLSAPPLPPTLPPRVGLRVTPPVLRALDLQVYEVHGQCTDLEGTSRAAE